jgi:hypothetical protein
MRRVRRAPPIPASSPEGGSPFSHKAKNGRWRPPTRDMTSRATPEPLLGRWPRAVRAVRKDCPRGALARLRDRRRFAPLGCRDAGARVPRGAYRHPAACLRARPGANLTFLTMCLSQSSPGSGLVSQHCVQTSPNSAMRCPLLMPAKLAKVLSQERDREEGRAPVVPEPDALARAPRASRAKCGSCRRLYCTGSRLDSRRSPGEPMMGTKLELARPHGAPIVPFSARVLDRLRPRPGAVTSFAGSCRSTRPMMPGTSSGSRWSATSSARGSSSTSRLRLRQRPPSAPHSTPD